MAKLESFELDHNLVKAPYVRRAGVEEQETPASKIRLRFLQQIKMPYLLVPCTLWSILAVNLRDYLTGSLIPIPWAAARAFALILWGNHTPEEIRNALTTVLEKTRGSGY